MYSRRDKYLNLQKQSAKRVDNASERKIEVRILIGLLHGQDPTGESSGNCKFNFIF